MVLQYSSSSTDRERAWKGGGVKVFAVRERLEESLPKKCAEPILWLTQRTQAVEREGYLWVTALAASRRKHCIVPRALTKE